MEWVALALALVAALVAWRAGWLDANFLHWLAAIFCAISIVWLANMIAEYRREKVVSGFINFVSSAVGNGQPPHIVAHSLGSFVLGRTLFRFPEFKTGKIVLLGCVLRPGFQWDILRNQFELVRNELGAKDWVGSIASLLRPFVPEMGPSGKKGFRKPIGAVEKRKRDTAGAPWRPCPCGICQGGVSNLAVLNVDGPSIGHTDLTAVKIRAQRRWLPYFWDIPPDHFERFIELCLECDILEEEGNPKLLAKVDELLSGCWYWSQGPLQDFLHRYLSALPLQSDPHHLKPVAIRSVATNLFRTVAEANRANDSAQRRYLYPMHALRFAVKRTQETGE